MKTSLSPAACLLLAACASSAPAASPAPKAQVAPPAFVELDGKPLAQANAADADGHIRHVPTPALRLLRSQAAQVKGTVLLFPGGGYSLLAADHEGARTAAFLNAQGFDVAQLDYTVSAGPTTRDLALKDALAAWRLLKTQAKPLALHDARLAVMGYSAGGHLAARMAAQLPRAEQPADLVLVYPAYLDEAAVGAHAPAIQPPAHPTGRLFALIAANDKAQWVAGMRAYAAAWKETGGDAQVQVLQDGGHGFGMKKDLPGAAKTWPDLLAAFLKAEPINAAMRP